MPEISGFEAPGGQLDGSAALLNWIQVTLQLDMVNLVGLIPPKRLNIVFDINQESRV